MVNDTLAELQKAAKELRDGLKDVDEDIKKLTGRDPSEPARPGSNRRVQLKRTTFQRGNSRPDEPMNKQRRPSDGSTNRRWGRTVHMGSRFSMDEDRKLDSSGEEDESSKPAIQSVVAAEIKPVRSQTKVTAEDRQTKSRNRRMFGFLVGTLQKFKDDTEQKTPMERKREAIERKLEKKAEEEKQELSSQRRELFQARKSKKQELRNLERKMENAVLKEEIAAHNKDLMNFIQLKSKPTIFYLPAKHNSATRLLLEESRINLQELQDEKCRNMDLDADDFGMNTSFTKTVRNGKRLTGRVVEVRDLSHRDLFEEDREQDENEMEGSRREEARGSADEDAGVEEGELKDAEQSEPKDRENMEEDGEEVQRDAEKRDEGRGEEDGVEVGRGDEGRGDEDRGEDCRDEGRGDGMDGDKEFKRVEREKGSRDEEVMEVERGDATGFEGDDWKVVVLNDKNEDDEEMQEARSREVVEKESEDVREEKAECVQVMREEERIEMPSVVSDEPDVNSVNNQESVVTNNEMDMVNDGNSNEGREAENESEIRETVFPSSQGVHKASEAVNNITPSYDTVKPIEESTETFARDTERKQGDSRDTQGTEEDTNILPLPQKDSNNVEDDNTDSVQSIRSGFPMFHESRENFMIPGLNLLEPQE